MLGLLTLLLWISPGLGDDKPPDCKAFYLKVRCNDNRQCAEDLCSYLYPRLPSRNYETCLDFPSDCTPGSGLPSKRGILNKNVAYLLLKLHPFLNQTSQLGFLTSGRFRRIAGNFGTEFLGKRSNTKSAGSRTPGRTDRNPGKPTPSPSHKFYSLPLDKFAKSKILKRDEDAFYKPWEKRLSLRGNQRVILGSEFLGKRNYDERFRRLSGTEFLGKRNDDLFDGSEFLGKRMTEEAEKRQQGPLGGTELLGKKSSSNRESGGWYQTKRFGNELLGKRMAEELQQVKDQLFMPDYDPELIDEVFSTYFQTSKLPIASHFCRESESAICGKLKTK